eukprot:IDg9616t1
MSLIRSTQCAFLLVFLSLHAVHTVSALSAREATNEGVRYFAKRCAAQQTLTHALVRAIAKGDLADAKAAYVESRPPYEEIEVLAPAFPDLDEAIDARPYVFPTGEDDPGFAGFHLVERKLYRDGNVSAALAPARALNESVVALCKVLSTPTAFTPHKSWEGLLALAFEVPAKKMSSEEETWSDLSMSIFRANFRGIYETYRPFERVTPGASEASIAAVRSAYASIVAAVDGLDTRNGFAGRIGGSALAYSSMHMEPRRQMQGLAYAFAAALEKVREELDDQIKVPVSPSEAEEQERPDVDDKRYAQAARQGVRHFSEQCALQISLVHDFLAELSNPQVTLKSAKLAYARARPPYEQIETIAGSFEEEDSDIDSRPYAHDRGELNKDFRGFHAIERALYRDEDIKAALAWMPALRKSVESLCTKLANPDATRTFGADTTWKGMIALAYEVPAKKIASEEEMYSDLSLLIFRENLKGIYSQYAPFKQHVSAASAKRVEKAHGDVKTHLQMVDSGNDWEKGLDFRPYSKVSVAERKGISDSFYELGRALVAARDTLEGPPESK